MIESVNADWGDEGRRDREHCTKRWQMVNAFVRGAAFAATRR